MKISIAQLVSGDPLPQINESIIIGYKDDTDFIVYPAYVFESPGDPSIDYNTLDIALYIVAMQLRDTREKPIRMLFPFFDSNGDATFLYGYNDCIHMYSYTNEDEFYLSDKLEDIEEDLGVVIEPHIHRIDPAKKVLDVEGMSFGIVTDYNSYELEKRSPKDGYAYDVMLFFNTAMLVYRENAKEIAEIKTRDLDELAELGYAKSYIADIESCGLYDEYVFKGGSSIVTTKGRLLGQCPEFDAGVLSADLRLSEDDMNPDGVVKDPIMYERLDVSLKNPSALVKDTLHAIELALRNYANRLNVDTIILPLTDTFTAYFLFTLACSVFDDRKIVGVAYEEYQTVALQYDLDKIDDLVYVPIVEGAGPEKIEGMYQACERMARYSDGLALIPECMSDYIQNHQAPFSNRYVFAPFSHLLYSDIFRIKDAFEKEEGKGPSLKYDEPGLDYKIKDRIDKMALECVDAYLSYEYEEAIDIPSAIGRIWDRSQFDAQKVLRNLDTDIPKMRYFIRAFYGIMDDLLYNAYLSHDYSRYRKSEYFNKLSFQAKEQFVSYRIRGLSSTDSVAQGIIFRYPMREIRAIPPVPPSDLPPLNELMAPMHINAVEGISFNFDNSEGMDEKVGQLPLNKTVNLRSEHPSPKDPLDLIDPSIKEQLFKAIADALGHDDEDNPAKYMLDMYRLASLTDDSENDNNLFSQN